jgi:regulatory protein
VCASIVRIEVAGPERRARRLVFDDGHEPREVSAAIVRELGLQEGSQVDPHELERSLDAVEFEFAKARALQLLGYRERSQAELASKLVASGYPLCVAASVVARFVEVELVDDRRLASAFVRSKAAAGYGDRRIARELRAKGVSEDLVSEVLVGLASSGCDVVRARASLRGRVPADAAEARKLVRRLVGRGFDLSVAIQAVDPAVELDDADTP